jgi:hypothetical protein
MLALSERTPELIDVTPEFMSAHCVAAMPEKRTSNEIDRTSEHSNCMTAYKRPTGISPDSKGGFTMKAAILGSTLLLAISIPALAAEKDLYGTWKMVSQTQKMLDTGEVRKGRGDAPNGYMTFTPDGRVIGVITSDNRPKPESVAKMTDQQRIELFNSMNAYAGTFKLEGNKLTRRYDVTHNQVADRAAVGEIKIEGRKLTMVNAPARATKDGKSVQTTTVWEKVQAPAGKK